jgi:hypothetical protein
MVFGFKVKTDQASIKNKKTAIFLKYFDYKFFLKQTNKRKKFITIIMPKCPEGSYLGRQRYWIVWIRLPWGQLSL